MVADSLDVPYKRRVTPDWTYPITQPEMTGVVRRGCGCCRHGVVKGLLRSETRASE